MFFLEIVIAIVIIVISACSHILYNKSVNEKKAVSRHKKTMLRSSRSLSDEEAAAARAYYNIDIQAGADVYRIEGGYNMVALSTNDTVFNAHHCIADIQVAFFKEWAAYLQDFNHADIVFCASKQKDIGYILNLNGVMDIRQLAAMKEKIQNSTPGHVAAADIDIVSSRLMTPAEAHSASTDIRFQAWLLITVGLWCAFFNAERKIWLYVSAGLLVVGIIRYLFKKEPTRKKVTCFKGRLVEKVSAVIRDDKLSTYKDLYIGDTAVKIPEHWKSNLAVNREYRAEGLLKIEANSKPTADLVAMGNVLSINTECVRFGYAAVGRHIMGFVFLAFSLFCLWLSAQQPYTKIKMAWNALVHSGEPVHYSFTVQGAVLIACITLLVYLVVRIVMFMRWHENRSLLIKQFYENNLEKEPSVKRRKEKDLSCEPANDSELPELSSAKISVGVVGIEGLEVDYVLFDGGNVWQDDGMPKPQIVPEVVTIRWGRHLKAMKYEATLRVDKELAAAYLKPDSSGDASPILTILIKNDNEAMAVRTLNYNLDDDLLLFDTAKGQRCFDLSYEHPAFEASENSRESDGPAG